MLLNYDSNDEFHYTSGGTGFNISMDEFEMWNSGVSTGNIADSDLNSGRRLDGFVAGDEVSFDYRNDPAGSSYFEIYGDVPMPVSNVAVDLSDTDGDGAAEINLTWDAVSNPDLLGYDVFAQQVINGIPTGDWVQVNDTGPNGAVKGTAYTGEIDGTPFNSGDTWQFVVLAINDDGGADNVHDPGDSYGPDSNIVQVDLPAVNNARPLVSEETEVVDNGTPGQFDDGDVVRVQYNQDIALASNANIRFKDLQDAEFATVTCGTNAVCQIGPSDTLTMTLQADPVPAGGIGGDGVIDHSEAVVEASSGITSAATGGSWFLPGSGVGDETTLFAQFVQNADSLTRVLDQDNPVEVDNNNLPDAILSSDIDAQDDSSVLKIDGDADIHGSVDIEQGDVVQVYGLDGTLIGSTTYDTTVGAQVNIGMLPAGTPLVVQYIDNNGDGVPYEPTIGTNANIPSASTFIRVVGDAPVVDFVSLVDADTILVYWGFPDPPLTEVKAASAYTVYNVDNTNLEATGDNVDLIDTDGDGKDDAALVDLDANLTDGTDYVLRVQGATVQNNNNVPNVGQAVPFMSDLTDLGPYIEITGFEEDVTSDPTPTFDGFLRSRRDSDRGLGHLRASPGPAGSMRPATSRSAPPATTSGTSPSIRGR